MCGFFREKSQFFVLSTFDQCELKKKIYILTKISTVCEKGHFLPFLAHCTHFRQNNLFFITLVDQKYSKQQFEIFP